MTDAVVLPVTQMIDKSEELKKKPVKLFFLLTSSSKMTGLLHLLLKLVYYSFGLNTQKTIYYVFT